MLAPAPVDHQGAGLLEVMLQGRERRGITLFASVEGCHSVELRAGQPETGVAVEGLVGLFLPGLDEVRPKRCDELGLGRHLARIFAVVVLQSADVVVGLLLRPDLVGLPVGGDRRVIAADDHEFVANEGGELNGQRERREGAGQNRLGRGDRGREGDRRGRFYLGRVGLLVVEDDRRFGGRRLGTSAHTEGVFLRECGVGNEDQGEDGTVHRELLSGAVRRFAVTPRNTCRSDPVLLGPLTCSWAVIFSARSSA